MENMTQTISISDARANLPELVDKTEKVMARFVISRKGEPAAVLLSADEYESLMETLEIMTDPKLVKEIERGLEDIRAGRVVPLENVKSFTIASGRKKSS